MYIFMQAYKPFQKDVFITATNDHHPPKQNYSTEEAKPKCMIITNKGTDSLVTYVIIN